MSLSLIEHRCHAITRRQRQLTVLSARVQPCAIPVRILQCPTHRAAPHRGCCGGLCRALRRRTFAAPRSNPHGRAVSAPGRSGTRAGRRGKQKPPRGFARPPPAALCWAAAPRFNMAELPRAWLPPARTARAPGRGLRSPRRAAARTEPPLCGSCSLTFARGPSPGARRARHAPRAECAASPVAAAGSAGNAVSTGASPGRRCGPAVPASPAAATPPFGGARAAAAASAPRPAGAEWPHSPAVLWAVARRGDAPLPCPSRSRRGGRDRAGAAQGLPAGRRPRPGKGAASLRVPEAAAPGCGGTCCRVLEEQTEGFTRG